jgi:hypothetical protein
MAQLLEGMEMVGSRFIGVNGTKTMSSNRHAA